MAAKHLPGVIINMTTAAKHPPKQNGGKVSANEQKGSKASASNPDDADAKQATWLCLNLLLRN
jgi:hypothetical protein